MTRKNKFFNATIAASLVATAIVGVAGQAEASQTFSDVMNSDYFYNDVINLTERGVIKGFEDGSFRPNDFVTRGQAAKIIAGALGLDTTAVANPNFKDIPTTHAYYGAIAALANAGIINGFEDETFRSGEPVQRNHMAKIIAGAFGLQASSAATPFTDVRADYAKYINALYEAGVTTGKTATTFDGASNVKRGQLAAFVVRAEGVAKTTATTFTISAITGATVQTSTGELAVDTALQSVLNAANSQALAGAEVTATVVNGTVKSISALTLQASGTADESVVFDAKNATIAGLTVNGDFVTVKNVTIEGNFIVAEQAKVNVAAEGVTVKGQLTVDNSSNSVASLVATAPVVLTLNLKDTTVSTVVVNRDQVTIASNKKLGTVTAGQAVAKLTVQADVTKLVVANSVTLLGKGTVDVVEVAKNVQLDYQVEGTIKQLIIADATAKLKLATTANIEKLVIPDGTTVAAVIQNYNAVKAKIGEVTSASGKAVAKATGGGGGSSSSKATDNKSEDNKQQEVKPEDNKKPEDKKPVETKPEDKEAEEKPAPQQPEFIETEIVTAGSIITTPGKYGPANNKLVVEGNLVIESADVTLQNVVVTGNLVLGAGIGEGDVHLNGVEVQGTTKVNGGGEHSVYFTDSVLATVIVNKNTGAVRIVAQGNTQVVEVQLESAATVEEQNLAEGFDGFEDVTLTEAMERSSNLAVSLVGTFESINSRVANVRINLPAETSIRELVLQVAATVEGLGTINTVYINNNGSTLAQRPQNVVLNIGSTVQIGNETVTESYDNAETVAINAITAAQNYIALDLSDFVSNVTSADLAIVAMLDEEEYELQNLHYVPSLSRYEFDPIPLTGNIGKIVTIVASPDTGRITGAPVEATYEISYGFAGRITDIHGAGAENATLTIRPLRLLTSGDTAIVTTTDAGSVTTTTDRFGYYSVNVPTAGEYEVEISGRNYLATSFRAFALSDWFGINEDENAMRAAGADEVKIVLTWGESPRDLDSHLTGPSGRGGNFHVYFGDKVDQDGNTTFVDLDWDDTSSYGPETTTIRKLLDGTYRFYVHNWSGETALNTSDAKVEVYKGNSNKPDYTFDIPTEQTYARNWLVFDLKVSQGGENIEIIPINIFSNLDNRINFYVMDGYDSYISSDSSIQLTADEGVEIRYAINAEPTLESPLYTEAIKLTESATINAIGIVNGVVLVSDSKYFELLTIESVEREVAEFEQNAANLDLDSNSYLYAELKGKLHAFGNSEKRSQLLNKISAVLDTLNQANYVHLEAVEKQLNTLVEEEKYLEAQELMNEIYYNISSLYSVENGYVLADRLHALNNTIEEKIASFNKIHFDGGYLTISGVATTFDTAQIALIESIGLDEIEVTVNAQPFTLSSFIEINVGNRLTNAPVNGTLLSTVTVRYKDFDNESHVLTLSNVIFKNPDND